MAFDWAKQEVASVAEPVAWTANFVLRFGVSRVAKNFPDFEFVVDSEVILAKVFLAQTCCPSSCSIFVR